MQRAVIYSRISEEEQSNFSMAGQAEHCRAFCERKGWALVGAYADEGASARSLDRPGWRTLEKELKTTKPDFIVVLKYDRYTRNVSEGLALMERLERRFNIRIVSVLEDFGGISPHSPIFFKLRADLLVNAEFERRVISDRTAFGTHAARTSGRYLGKAPFGYLNERDQQNKPIIVPHPEKAELVREAYRLYLEENKSLKEIGRILKPSGFTAKGNMAVKRLLESPVYCGYVYVKKYGDKEEHLVRGIHEPLVHEDLYWRALNKLSGKKGLKRVEDEDAPLRGFLLCGTCGQPLTSSRSRGRGGQYTYYFCHRHASPSWQVKDVHAQIMKLLRLVSLTPNEVQMMRQVARAELTRIELDNTKRAQHLRKQIEAIGGKKQSLEEKFIGDQIDSPTYQRWRAKLEADAVALQKELYPLEQQSGEMWAAFERDLWKLGELPEIWAESSGSDKRRILRLLFGPNFSKGLEGFRTDEMAIFADIKALEMNGLRIEKTTGQTSNLDEDPVSARNGAQLEPILLLLKALAA